MIILILPGSDIGKAKGSLRSDPEAGQDLECPCKVGTGSITRYLLRLNIYDNMTLDMIC